MPVENDIVLTDFKELVLRACAAREIELEPLYKAELNNWDSIAEIAAKRDPKDTPASLREIQVSLLSLYSFKKNLKRKQFVHNLNLDFSLMMNFELASDGLQNYFDEMLARIETNKDILQFKDKITL